MENTISYNLLGGTVIYGADILKYGELKKDFDDYGTKLAEAIGDFYNDNKTTIMYNYLEESKYNDYIYRQLWMIINHIDNYMKKYIKVLVENGVYDKADGYYTKNNPGIALLFEMTDLNYKIKSLMWEQMNDMALNQISDAEFNAYSQVQGNQYGIITNSISASILYGIENEYKVKKSTQRAERQYSSALDRIGEQTEKWFENQWGKQFVDYSQEVLSSIPSITNALFMLVIEDYVKCNIVDKDTSNYINREKSDNILSNIELASEKNKILLEALNADPFNTEVYKKICEEGYLDNDIVQFSLVFGMSEPLIEWLYKSTNNQIVSRDIDVDKFNDKVKYLSELSHQDEASIKKEVLKSLLEGITAIFKEIERGFNSTSHIEQIYSFLLRNNLPVDKNTVREFFEKVYIFHGMEILSAVLNEYEMRDYIKGSLKCFESLEEVKEYYVESYTKKIVNMDQVEKNRNEIIQQNKERIRDIGTAIDTHTRISYENKGKLFGEGAKKRKIANECISNLEKERIKLEEENEKLEKERTKTNQKIPFVDRELHMDDENYLAVTCAEILSKQKAGFITEEEAQKRQRTLIDDYTKYKLGGSLEDLQKMF